MTTRNIGIAIDGATGRLGTTQHLRSLMAIRSEGGLVLADGARLVPEPVLLGRNPAKLASLAAANGDLKWSTDRDACLADPGIAIYFDASATGGRPARARAALAAGKHMYLEKPIAETLDDALDLARRAKRAGLKNGVVQDKLFLPGLRKLRKLYDADFFGRIVSIRLDFGWWVFDGTPHPAQRPSWNYRKATGGGLILDMFAHWRYVFDRLLGEIKAVSCRHMTALPERRDENGESYNVDVEDTAFATFELVDGVLAQVTSSWASRVKRDDLLQIHVDGTRGSAVCGLHRCFVQPLVTTPKPFFDTEHRSRWSSTINGKRCRMSSQSATATALVGSSSSSTWPKTRRFRRPCSKAPRACSSPRLAIKAIESGAGSICRS
jgi:predicted dehydrogenase